MRNVFVNIVAALWNPTGNSAKGAADNPRWNPPHPRKHQRFFTRGWKFPQLHQRARRRKPALLAPPLRKGFNPSQRSPKVL